MLSQQLIALLPLLATLAIPSSGAPIKREVPQEHSHQKFITQVATSLNVNNPAGIVDPIFGLLGNAAAAAGQGSIANTDCLQQATADQAFTNAKAAGDVTGMTAALVYRALERNTATVGGASTLCTETPVNPEIAAISQHQDPASTGAAATNKAITLALAQQIASVGGDPQTALQAGTFAPGTIGDPTGAGNTCDDANDATGCIFTQNLLVEDATPAEISSAVAGIAVATPASAVAGATATASAVGVTAVATSSAAACEAVTPSSAAVDSASAVAAATTTSAAAAAAASASAAAGTTAAAAGIDVGACTDFSMTFAAGLQGRGAAEFSFEPTDLNNFNHGTALNPEIISQFMCDTFVNACGQSKSTQTACQGVKTTIDAQLAAGTLSKDQTYADAWLSGLETAFGIQSTGTGSGTGTAAGAGAAAAASSPAVAATTASTTAAAVVPTTTAASAAGTAASTGAAAAGAAGTNIQTFTSDLNNFPAPPVIQSTGDRPFTVNGDTFVNSAAALQRSCSIQFNGCADAANSGTGSSSVSDCQTQETSCNAATA